MMPFRAALTGALVLCAISVSLDAATSCDTEVEANATAFLNDFDGLLRENLAAVAEIGFIYYKDMTEANNMLWYSTYYQNMKEIYVRGEEATSISMDELCSDATKKELKAVLNTYRSAHTDSNEMKILLKEMANASDHMAANHNNADFCMEKDIDGTCLVNAWDNLRDSRNSSEREASWVFWLNAHSKTARPLYEEYLQLVNDWRNLSGYSVTNSSVTERWGTAYDTGEEGYDLEEDMTSLLDSLMPVLKQVMAYIRRRTKEIYSDYEFDDKPLFPSHFYGGMFSRDYVPFPNHTDFSITDELQRQNYTVIRMLRKAEDFFTSLNFSAMPGSFWNESEMVKPNDGRQFDCHPSAWVFGNGEYRIQMCASVTQEDFYTIHHEMAHVVYGMEYDQQPYVFHGAPNPGFHEALGDAISLSVRSTKHLKAIGLVDKDTPDDYESNINFLWSTALTNILNQAHNFATDKFGWDIGRGLVTPDNYNKHYWNLFCKYNGIVSPVERPDDYFDAAVSYHVMHDSSLIKYFASNVFQFQFYEALCNATNHTGPLYDCDFYNNTMAGNKLRDFMKPGLSIPWPDALEKLTGSRKMDIGPMMRYFQPLIEYLKEVNKDEVLDWEGHCNNITYDVTQS